MTTETIFVLCAVGGYFLGSVPFGLVLTKMAGLGDLRKIGSGNIGATNVLRTGRKDLALLTVLLDAFKAGIAAFIAGYIVNPEPYIFIGYNTNTAVLASLIAGFMGIIGHNFPVWLKFKGGKGVASSFGFILFTNPKLALVALFVWLFMAFTFKYSSLSALTAAALVPFFAYFMGEPVYSFFYTCTALLVIVRHHENIKRLINGEESKIKIKKK